MSSLRTQSTGGGVLGLSSISSDCTGVASTAAGSHSHSHSHRKHHHHHRSRSAPRAPEKPPRKRHLNPGQSLACIPSQIKLSMLNSGLISFGLLQSSSVRAQQAEKFERIGGVKMACKVTDALRGSDNVTNPSTEYRVLVRVQRR
ncbi:hypothetical protein HN011_003645, partial [Eciton burchellii]